MLSVRAIVLVAFIAIVALSVVPVSAAAAPSPSFHPDQRLSKGWFGVLTYKFVRGRDTGRCRGTQRVRPVQQVR